MFKILINTTLIIVGILISVKYANDLKIALDKDIALQKIQNKCIYEKIKLGVPRNQIERTDNGCKVI